MPIPTKLPKGCISTRGVPDIRYVRSQGTGLTQQANRLYMLTVKRESLMNKRRSLEVRLKEIKGQLETIERDTRATEKQFGKLKGNGARRKRFDEGMVEGRGNGRELKKMPLQF